MREPENGELENAWPCRIWKMKDHNVRPMLVCCRRGLVSYPFSSVTYSSAYWLYRLKPLPWKLSPQTKPIMCPMAILTVKLHYSIQLQEKCPKLSVPLHRPSAVRTDILDTRILGTSPWFDPKVHRHCFSCRPCVNRPTIIHVDPSGN